MKMNGETPSVPITTLAGISSLTDLLPQLPLPTPLPQTMHNKSLLYSSKIADDAKRIISVRSEGLAKQLAQALRQTSTNHIELKDTLVGDSIEGDVPPLLKAVFLNDPQVFCGRNLYDGVNTNLSQDLQQHGQNFVQSSQYSSSSSRVSQQNDTSRISNSQSSRFSNQNQNNSYSPSNSSHFQQEFNSFSRNSYSNSATINGDCYLSDGPLHPADPHRGRLNHKDQNKMTVSSPAQATSADRLASQQVTQQPSSSVPITNMDSDLTRSNRRRSSSRHSEPSVSLDDIEPSIMSSSRTSINKDGDSRLQKKTSGKNEPVVLLEMLDMKTLQSIATGGSVADETPFNGKPDDSDPQVKAVADSDSRKRRKNMTRDADGLHFNVSRSNDERGFSARLSRHRRGGGEDERQRGSKRGRGRYSESESEEDVYMEIPEEDEETYAAKKRKKDKKQKRHVHHTLTVEELLESPTFKKFSSCMDYVFDSAEEVNFASIDPNDDEQECPTESLIAKGVLGDICGEAAKLKTMGVMNQIPPDRLVKLLTILQWNIRDGIKVSPNISQDEDGEDEQRLWRELTMERIMRSMDASLSAIFVMTARDMPKQVYLEDVIDRIILFGKYQLANTVYPEFDPVYKLDPNAKDGYHGSLKAKRARAGTVKHKSTITLYNKLCELVNNLAGLLEIQELTDTVILQVSSLGVSTFFVENISELQLSAMKLVTTVFSRYEKHRQLILEDIFASLARLPSSKRNLRNYRLNSEESIQMVTALALQLIQCVVRLPTKISSQEDQQEDTTAKKKKNGKTDEEIVIVTSYETAMRTGYNFLSVFLKKCTTKGEEDYRPLFENFVQDLLSTVNKPEWPASELLLSLLGRILVQQFSNKSTDMSLRVASLEYLGIVAARLRKDAVTSHLNQEMIDDIVDKVNESDDEDHTTRSKKKQKGPVDTTQSFQEAMLQYLAHNAENDPSLLFARQFYMAQWFRDSSVEAEKTMATQAKAEEDFDETEAERSTEVMQNVEKRKNFLLNQVAIMSKILSNSKPAPSKLDYDSACLVARYLSSKRPFAQSFDVYLTQILKVLSETAVAVRTKAMKCLSAVVEADPGILARSDMQRGVHGRFLDQSTSVREAAIELVGKFILIRPELIPKYYDMLSERILDTGISVRKRVIKIFKDICIEQPDNTKIPEMCVKMIRRVNDEEGIKKLINEVFQSMWFSPLPSREKDPTRLVQRVMNISDVVAACKDTGYDFFEQMLENLLKKDENGQINKSALLACKQIVDCLVENVLRIEEKGVELTEGRTTSSRLVACLSTLYLFSKIKPDLMVSHATTLQPYLDIKCSTQGDYLVLHYVARILELVVPLMDHPSETFLAQLEEDMMKLVLKHGMMVLQSCVSCLGAVVNNVSHNYQLVKDCFQKFFGVLTKLMADHRDDPHNPTLKSRRPTLLRSLYTVGLLCKHFDFDSPDMGETKVNVKERVFNVLLYFMYHEDEDVTHKALTALGFMVSRHYEFMLGKTMRDLYYRFLTGEDEPVKLRCQVLRNLQNYLIEEEFRMEKADAEWRKHAKEEDLKEMGDVQSGMASTIMQVYLKQVLESFFHEQAQNRLAALGVVILILKQGLVHPVQCVPYLISMSSDPEAAIRIKADQQLEEIEKKYPGFTHMKALQGLKASFRLQEVLNKNAEGPIRGIRNHDDNNPQSLNAFLYTVLRTNRQYRRGLLTSLLNLFDDSARVSLKEQVYIADNLAFFNYQTQDEPLFIIHHIDVIVSVTGSNLLQSFREALNPKKTPTEGEETAEKEIETVKPHIEDDDDDDPESLLKKLPPEIKPLQDIINLSQGCVLLLVMKQHLKDMFGFTDSKIYKYSPTESAKTYDKPLNRKQVVKFNPTHTLEVLVSREKEKDDEVDEEAKKQKLVDDYLEFRDLMMSIDPMDDDDSGDEKSSGRGTPVPGGRQGDGSDVVPMEGEGGVPLGPGGDGATTPSGSNEGAVPSSAYSYAYIQRPSKLPPEKKKRSHTPRAPRTPKTPTVKKEKKKKKRRRRISDDEDDESDDDPDFVL
ncbi:nipped-B-like protein isoform X3 [Haliotis rufescens]|uniref:nipped-B-like protein isoform X3 n=1 Tax=Haliotis rufescens TaxID=6454 RepID=UPI001EB08F43|nr:nipped-B-like protein isoform X3 [Haliotis rufescens]